MKARDVFTVIVFFSFLWGIYVVIQDLQIRLNVLGAILLAIGNYKLSSWCGMVLEEVVFND